MSYQIKQSLQNVLAGKFFPIVTALIAVALTFGTLETGLQLDDYYHQHKLQQDDLLSDNGGILTNLFNFMHGSTNDYDRGLKSVHLPWWTARELKIKFFRPIAAMTHWLDYRLWPEKPSMMHLHSLFWLSAMVMITALFYRRMLTPLWVAGLAGLLFAIDDAHGVPAGWLANRNSLIAATFGFLSLYCHDRWRRGGWRAGALFGPVLFVISLLSAEAGLGAGAYFFAYEVFMGKGGWRKRAVSFAPYVLVVVVWWISYKTMGFGTFASGAYIDPGRNPLNYLQHLMERVPVLLYGQWFFPDAMTYLLIPEPIIYGVLAVIYLLIAGLAVLFVPLLKHNAASRFFALGMVLSLLPVCATFPHNRLLLFAGFGAFGLLAQFLAYWLEQAAWFPANQSWRILAKVSMVVLIIVHLIIAPLLLTRTSRMQAWIESVVLGKPLSQLSRDHEIAEKDLIFINPPDAFITIVYSKAICKELKLQMPRVTYALSSGMTSSMTIRRVDEKSLEITPDIGFISTDVDRLFRDETHPMQVGDRVKSGDMTAEVISLTKDKRPLCVRFTFSKPLEDSSLAFFAWKNDDYGYAPFAMPDIGHSKHLKVAKVPLI